MEFLKKYKKIFITSLVGFSLLLFIISAVYQSEPTFFENSLGYVVVPVQQAFTDVSSWFSRQIGFFTNINSMGHENERLREESALLWLEIDRLRLVEQDNIALTELLKISQRYPDFPKLGARVVGSNPSNWHSTFMINRGANYEIERNMVVLGAGGLVGRIIEVRSNHSKVLTIIDDTSSVAVQSLRTGETGILSGDIMLMQSGLGRMEYIDINADIQEGDEIITSHLSGIYPQGISVGFVTQITNDLNSITKTAIIRPSVNFRRLEEVLVITEVFNVDFD
ncbi:MAG: rod shape-determining protein MreC [Defluviitaleaceae bacterium]|nr:rod shape-determining protein MreC [Defluviitaleaceae bacterium]